MNLADTSSDASADTPSKEFCWAYLQISPSYTNSMFFRTEQEAIDAANDEYRNFTPGMKQYTVLIVQVTKGWNL